MKNQLFGLAAGMVMLAMLSVGSVAGATDFPELAINGGFETGDLTGWTQSGNMTIGNNGWGGTGLDATPGFSSEGAYFFWAANSPDMGYLSQTIATTPGLNYTISFQLANDNNGGDPLGEFTASFGGIMLLDLTNQPYSSWVNDQVVYTNYSYTLFGYTGDSAELKFGFYNSPGYWSLDAVSVKDPGPDCVDNCPAVPEPSTWLLFGSGLAGLAAWRYRTGKRVTA